jgi:hypothetical protein
LYGFAVRDLIVGKDVELVGLTLDRFQEDLLEELISPICAVDMSIDDCLIGLVRR